MNQKYDFKRTEREMQKFWEENEIYKFQNGREKKIFSIDTPPPTVSGSLHIGHVFSYTQAEMIARFKRMQGYDVFYPFGFDDNGLPTERLVEKERKIRARDIPGKEFRRQCMETVEGYEADFREMWKSLGFSVDWDLEYHTVSEESRKISQKLFLELVKKGKAYMKESPVLWCTQCQTSIAQAELETKESESCFYYLVFDAGEKILPVATTRPELLPGCACVLVHPADKRYKKYVGRKVKVPLYGFEIPVLEDDGVSMEKGTGAVMCATFGDSTDAEWYEKFSLPYKEVITKDGRIAEHIPFTGGMKTAQARRAVALELESRGLIIKKEELIHAVAVHERCGTDVEIIPSRQWYIDILTEKERFIKAADEIRWHPARMKSRYLDWVQNLKWDWCISRQRYFGVPFPVWYCAECKKPILADPCQLPVDPEKDRPLSSCSCGCTEVIPERAVFDTWATSSISPLINARYGEEGDRSRQILPMGMRHQAHEIIRTWAFYTIVRSLYHTGEIPWKDIMVSGFVLAKPGEKISKSKNNASSSPMELIEMHSADAIRYWAANARLGTDTFFSEDELKASKRFINKLYNAAKFSMAQLGDFELNGDPAACLLPVDRWILQRVNETSIKTGKLLEEYEAGQARHELDELFWKDFCDYYIEIVKERLYQPGKHGADRRRSGQYALYSSLLEIMKMYSVFVPHITDYLYQEFFRKFEPELSIHQKMWKRAEGREEDILAFGMHMKDLISSVRRYKTEHGMSMKDKIGRLQIRCPEWMTGYYRETEQDLSACTGATEIIYTVQ